MTSTKTEPRKEPGRAHPFLLEQPGLEFDHAPVGHGVPHDGMLPLLAATTLVHLDELAASRVAQPYPHRRLDEVGVRLPLTTIEGCNDRHVDHWDTEQLHQVEGQRGR